MFHMCSKHFLNSHDTELIHCNLKSIVACYLTSGGGVSVRGPLGGALGRPARRSRGGERRARRRRPGGRCSE